MQEIFSSVCIKHMFTTQSAIKGAIAFPTRDMICLSASHLWVLMVATTVELILQAYGDRAFYNDIVRAMKLQAAKNKENVYCYKFSYRGKYSLTNLFTNDSKDYGELYIFDV
jgi:hypothetical protein